MSKKLVKTIAFALSCGVVAGYGDALAQAKEFSIEEFSAAYQEVAAAVFKDMGVYISATISPAKTVYHVDWGCPVGGEQTFSVTGVCNPQFTDLALYKEAVVAVAEALRARFDQSTLTIEFRDEEMVYLTKS